MKKFIKIFMVYSMLIPAVSLGKGGGNSAAQLDRYAPDPLSATYLIDGVAVPMRDGRYEECAAPGSAAMIRTYVFGQPAYGDIDGDGDGDAAEFLSHDPGGTGTFFYVAIALNENGNYRGTNAVLLGDRVITQNLKIRSGVIVANYFDRSPQEPMAVPVVLKDSGEKVIAKGYATAKDEWRTNSFVPFDLEITFNVPTSGNRGTLILKKDNPTDLPEHDDELEVAVYFPNEDLLGANLEQKTTFNISKLDESGLYGPPDAKRALAYEFCIPDTVQNRTEVKRIDPTVKFFAQSPGRIGYKEHENLCIGSTHQKDFRWVLQRLVELTYVQRIDQSFFE